MALLILGLGACATSAGRDAVDVRWYRYGLELRSGDTRYVDPLDPGVVEGRRYRVEADARGRIVRVATFIGRSKVAEIRYRFEGAGADADGYESWAADGEATTRVTIQRDAQGRRTRQEFALLDGRLTSYRVRAYEAERVESTQYAANGRREGRTLLTYSAQDVLTRSRWYPGDASTYYDTEFDERTGLATGRRKYRHGALDSSSREAYDAGGLATRSTHYSADGRRFGVTEFTAGLKIASRYDLGDGSTLEIRFAHDAKRRTREARYAYNERHVCTLVYERLANGRVVRSLALGPDGQVWAEYPDLYVEYIERSGEAVDRPGAAKIYREGPWWPGRGDRWVGPGAWPDPARRQPLGARDRASFSVHPLIVVPG